MQKSDILVYVAGPLTGSGRLCENIRTAVEVWKKLRDTGLTPVVPHGLFLVELIVDEPERFWLDYDLDLLRRCNCVLRLPGISPGSDLEVKTAEKEGIPVLYSVEEVITLAEDTIASCNLLLEKFGTN